MSHDPAARAPSSPGAAAEDSLGTYGVADLAADLGKSVPGAAAGEPTDAELLDHIAVEYGYRVTEAVDEEMAANAHRVAQRLKFLAAALRSASPVRDAMGEDNRLAFAAMEWAGSPQSEENDRDLLLAVAKYQGFRSASPVAAATPPGVAAYTALRAAVAAPDTEKWLRLIEIAVSSDDMALTRLHIIREHVEKWRAAVAAPGAGGADPARCDVCGWPLAQRREDGCVPGDCAYRPHEGTDEWFRIKARREAIAARPQGGAGA